MIKNLYNDVQVNNKIYRIKLSIYCIDSVLKSFHLFSNNKLTKEFNMKK